MFYTIIHWTMDQKYPISRNTSTLGGAQKHNSAKQVAVSRTSHLSNDYFATSNDHCIICILQMIYRKLNIALQFCFQKLILLKITTIIRSYMIHRIRRMN